MSLDLSPATTVSDGFPRVSGDEPCLIIVGVDTTMFSLREWG